MARQDQEKLEMFECFVDVAACVALQNGARLKTQEQRDFLAERRRAFFLSDEWRKSALFFRLLFGHGYVRVAAPENLDPDMPTYQHWAKRA